VRQGSCTWNDTFYLASEVEGAGGAGRAARWDHDMLHDLHFVSHPPDRTPFAGIYQLSPGSRLMADGDHVRVSRYWDWDYPSDAPDVGAPPVNQSLYVWGKTMLPNYILSNLGDRMEMAHSVEGRLPFLERRRRHKKRRSAEGGPRDECRRTASALRHNGGSPEEVRFE
jgi:asparagine synthetase B (glutamine-hydrolysing)